ncbi:PASTA domain-containing protein [Streptomyces griseorubiginosus]|nr:PASTA domain-containing protein [Streptomyces griseorubiginosus]
MTLRAFMHRAGKSAFRWIAVLLVFVLALSGCDRSTPLTLVRAVAAGVPSLAPFFDESGGLGHDEALRPQAVRGSLQQGDTPGLYGGTRRPTICDVRKLKAFLTAPGNHRKAQAWATALGISTDRIPGYLDRLTPVLLRHDTLVRNHDYRKGKAVPFDSLLQAGIAILVDQQGAPAVKCSCGNPLRPFTHDTNRISVKFENGNRKWKGFTRSSVVAVRPAPRKMERLALVDVGDPNRGIDRPVGTTGTRDKPFDAGRRRAVPDLTGTTFGRASRVLAAQGLAAGYAGKALPADDALVTASDPPAGTELPFGQYVTLSTAGGSSPGSTSVAPSTPPLPPPPGPSGSVSPHPSPPTPPSSGSSSGPGPSSAPTPPSSPPPSSQPPSSPPPPSSAPPSTAGAGQTTGKPATTSAGPPTSKPATTVAPAPPSGPTTTSPPPTPGKVTSSAPPPPATVSAPATSGPTSGAPGPSGPGSSGSASGAIT